MGSSSHAVSPQPAHGRGDPRGRRLGDPLRGRRPAGPGGHGPPRRGLRATCAAPPSTSRSWGPKPSRSWLCAGSKHATGFLQSKVAARLQTRFTPVLSFKLDDSVKKSVEIGRLIDEAIAVGPQAGEPGTPPTIPPPDAGSRTRIRAKRRPTIGRRKADRPDRPTSGARVTAPTRPRRAEHSRLPSHPDRITDNPRPWPHKANRSS